MKYIILSILVLFSLSAYSQIEDTPLFVGKYFGNQSGGGSGYWQVTGNFTDESGYYDATSIQVGDVLFFVDAGIGYHLPVTSIISASGSSFTIRVNNTGISGVAGVPNGSGGIYRANSPKGIWPFTAGLTASDQQTLNSFLIKRLNNEPVKRDTFITVPHSTNYIPNLVITTPSRFYNNIYLSCKGISDTSVVAFLAAPTSDHYGVVYNIKNDSGLVETRVLSDAHLSNVKTSYLLRRGQTAQVRALKDQAQSGAYKWAVNLLWDSVVVSGGGSGITALTGDVTASGTGSVAATIANDAVTSAKIASNAVDSTKAANLSPNDLAQTGASTGQVLTWTGSKYAPRDVSGGGGSETGWKMVFQNSAPTDTTVVWVDTLLSNSYLGCYPVRFRVPGAWQQITDTGLWWDYLAKDFSYGKPFVMAVSGQSNAGGCYYTEEQPSNPPAFAYGRGDTLSLAAVQIWNGTSWKIVRIGTDMFSSGANHIHQFAKLVVKNMHRSVRIIYDVYGGQALVKWAGTAAGQPDTTAYYVSLKTKIVNSKATKLDYFSWSQGESGCDCSGSTYYVKFKQFIDSLKTESFWAKNKTIFLTHGHRSGDAANDPVTSNEAEEGLRKLDYDTDPNTGYVSARGLSSNNLHYTCEGHEELARRMFSRFVQMPDPNRSYGFSDVVGLTGVNNINTSATGLNLTNNSGNSFLKFTNGDIRLQDPDAATSGNQGRLTFERFLNKVELRGYNGDRITFTGDGNVQVGGTLFYGPTIRSQAGSNPEFQLYDVSNDMFKIRNVAASSSLDFLYGISANTRVLAMSRTGQLYINPITTAFRTVKLDVNETATSGLRGQLFGQYSVDSKGSRTFTRKARGTQASPGALSTGDTLSADIMQGYDGTNYLDGARISVISGTVGSGSLPSNWVIETNSGSALVEGLRVNSAQETIIPKPILTGTVWLNSGKTVGIFTGTGDPESVVTASVGSTFHRTDGGAGTSFYVKETGSGNTGWVAK